MANNIPTPIVSNLHFDSDEEARRVILEEGRKLKYCAIKVWRQYLSSYKPTVYAEHLGRARGTRTLNSSRSIQLGSPQKIGDTWTIEVTFANDLAYHPSVQKGGKEGHAIMLISQGWGTPNSGAYRFDYYEGFDYLNKVNQMYSSMKDRRVGLEIQWLGNGKYTR